MIDFGEVVARKKLGLSDEWEACLWECVGDARDVRMALGIPRLLKSGKHKGSKTWRDSKLKECIVTEKEWQDARNQWSLDTGKCVECQGNGKVPYQWDIHTGTSFRPCKDCEASGLRKAA